MNKVKNQSTLIGNIYHNTDPTIPRKNFYDISHQVGFRLVFHSFTDLEQKTSGFFYFIFYKFDKYTLYKLI